MTDLRDNKYKPLDPSPNLEKFIRTAAKGGSLMAQQVMALRNPDVQHIAMERALLYPEIWEAVSEQENWGSQPVSSRGKYYHQVDQSWALYFKLTMEDIRDGESIENALETVLQ